MTNLKYSVLPNLDGSCELSTANSKVITGVSGPLEPKQRHRLPLQSAIEVVIKPSFGMGPTPREVLMQDKLATVLQAVIVTELYPRKLVQVNAQILESPFDEFGSMMGNSFNEILSSMIDLNSCFNSSFISLCDSAIALKSSFVSTLLGVTEDKLINIAEISDLDLLRSFNFKSLHHIVLEVEENKPTNVLLLDSQGDFNDDDLVNVLDNAQKITQKEFQNIRNILKDKVSHDFIWKA